MRIDDEISLRIGVSCIGGNGVFSNDPVGFFEGWPMTQKPPMLEVPAFCRWTAVRDHVYSVHAYKELFVQEPAFVRYYLGKLWQYMKDVGGKLAVFHAEKSVPPTAIAPQWFEGDAVIGFENTSDAVFQYAETFGTEDRFGIVLDTAHAVRLGIPIEEYLRYRICHVHVKGWDEHFGYRRIKPDDVHIINILKEILRSGYKGMFILEYPYHSKAEWLEDRDVLKKILEELLLL